jgi:signal transduction histidine kinase
MYIIKGKRAKKICLSLSLVMIMFFCIYVSPIFILLMPINIYEMIVELKASPLIGIIISLTLISIVNNEFIKDYILVASLSYIICNLYYNNFYNILKLREENYKLRKRNYELNKSLNKDAEYEMQIRYLSQIEERNKIAQEIHDNIGHTISGSLMQLEAIKFLLDRDLDKSKTLLQSTIDVLREGMESIRLTLRNIKPPSEQIGVNRLKLILHEFEVNSQIQISFFYNGDLNKISYNHWNIINSNVKEALTNILKYSKASQVKIKIQILNKYIKAEIKDNGIGNSSIKKGIGITGMEERCENVNGKLIVDGSEGFSIIMLLPI